MRLIDADVFKENMDFICDAGGWLEPVTKAVREFVKKHIDAQTTVHPEPHWISCKERLPESFQEVLVCGDNGDMDVIVGFTVDGIDDKWIWQMSPKLLFVKKIVAWQPLPERYREEGAEE